MPKARSIEEIYQKKTQLEHILLRPDTYIGSVQKVTEPMWVWEENKPAAASGDESPVKSSGVGGQIVRKEITYVPGFYKIFDEILVNACDNKQRDPKMDTIKIELNNVPGIA